MKKNTRKLPCEICGVNTGVNHRKNCTWHYVPRPTNKARHKLTIADKILLIWDIVRAK